MEYPSKVFQKSIEALSQFPGIGKHTAVRLTLHLLKQPISNVESISRALENLANKIVYCTVCHNISEDSTCYICSNPMRNKDLICVVEDIRDVLAIENTQQFNGVYHVLGGKISPMEGVGPLDLNIISLKGRVLTENIEIIFALSATIEGDTTSFYIYRLLKNLGIKFSSISRGIGVGEELEFTDSATLARSIQNRISYQMKVDDL